MLCLSFPFSVLRDVVVLLAEYTLLPLGFASTNLTLGPMKSNVLGLFLVHAINAVSNPLAMQGLITECLNHILLHINFATIPLPVVIARKYGLPRHITGSGSIPVL